MREWEVIDSFVAVFLLLIGQSVSIAVFELLIRFDKGFFLDFLIKRSIHKLLVELFMGELDQACLAIFRHTTLFFTLNHFLVNLFLQVAHYILVMVMVEYDSLGESVARLPLDKGI